MLGLVQPQVGRVDKGRGVQGLSDRILRQSVNGEPPQFLGHRTRPPRGTAPARQPSRRVIGSDVVRRM
jgi:hypothetical protein